MVFNISLTEDRELEEVREQAIGEYNQFFGLNWTQNTPNIYILPDRRTIDALRGVKTERWVVGFGRPDLRGVFLLDKNSFETESDHKYSKEYYISLIRHELCHSFINKITEGNYKPVWLIEGVCVYLSGQLSLKRRPDKLSHFLSSWDKADPKTYSESGFAVEILVKVYGKEKLLALLKGLKDIKDEGELQKIFEKIYRVELGYGQFNF